VPSLIPGLVVGALALLGFIFFVIWLLVGCCAACCCCCRGARRRQALAEAAAANGATQQFIPSQVGAPLRCAALCCAGSGPPA
jgi:hypothetical protein